MQSAIDRNTDALRERSSLEDENARLRESEHALEREVQGALDFIPTEFVGNDAWQNGIQRLAAALTASQAARRDEESWWKERHDYKDRAEKAEARVAALTKALEAERTANLKQKAWEQRIDENAGTIERNPTVTELCQRIGAINAALAAPSGVDEQKGVQP